MPMVSVIMAINLKPNMASNLEEMVTCAICTMRLREPKHLQCQHSFCTHCLVEWMASPTNVNHNTLPCPSCRHLTQLPPRGVDGLPADFNKNVLLEMLSLHTVEVKPVKQTERQQQCATCRLDGVTEKAVAYCNDCEESLCTACLENHSSEPALQDHCIQEDLTTNGYVCDVHAGKKLSFYCPQCSHLICVICLRTAHLGHGALTIKEASQVKKDALRDVLVLIEQMRKSIERACPFSEHRQMEIMFETLGEEIHEHAKNAKLCIDQWLDQACKDLGKRQEILQTKMEKKEQYMAMLMSLQAYYEEWLIDPDTHGLLTGFDELLSHARLLLDQKDDAFHIPRWSFVPRTWPFHLGYLEKEDEAVFLSSTTKDAAQEPHCTVNEVNPSECEIQETEHSDFVQRLPEVHRCLSECHGEAWPETSQYTTDVREEVTAEQATTTNDYREVENMPIFFNRKSTVLGATMSSNLYGNAIVNGKLKIRPIKTWINPSDDDDLITRTSDIILGCADWLLVADASRGRVQRLWFNGLGQTPETILQAATPRRMAISGDGSIAVTDEGYVHMLAIKDNVISARPKWTPQEMVQPFAVGFTEETEMQRIILTDMHSRKVVVYDENLRHIISFGGRDAFGSPNCLCCDSRGRIIVSDQTKNNVQAFSLAGNFLWKIDHFAPHEPLVAPSAVSADGCGNIYVGCVDGHVGVYSSDGHFICHLVDQYDTATNVRGIACRTDMRRTLIAIGGATNSYQSMVRLWELPELEPFL